MKLRIHQACNNLPLSVKILCGFLSLCCTLTVASGMIYYRHSKRVVEDSIRGQAQALCTHVEREFSLQHAAPVEHELRLLVTSPQLNNYLMSPKEEMLIQRAEVERLFLSLSQGRDIYLATTFLDASGQETIGTCGNVRQRVFRSLAQRAAEGLPGRNLQAVFTALKSGTASALAYCAPFRDAEDKLAILVGMAKQEPEAGGFGGAVIQCCDLTGFVRDVSQNRILGTAAVWVYGRDGTTLAAPPQSEIRQDPGPHLAQNAPSADGYVYTARCCFRAGDAPVLTVVCSIPRQIIARQLVPVVRSVLLIFSVLLAASVAGSLLISRWIDSEIVQRKQAEEALRRERDRAQVYLDVAEVMLLALNERGQITLINRKGSHILGYAEQELLGRDWFETCLPPAVRPNAQRIFRLLMSGQVESAKYTENPVRTRSGEERVLAWHNTILRDETGRIRATLSSGEDITERKEGEKEQTQLLQKLSEINQELKEFAYVVSHDLKAPLRAIRTLADWLVTDYQDKLDAQGKENLQLLSSRVDRMQNLIDGVLQYSRVGRTEEGTKPVDLGRVVPEIIADLAAPAHIAIRIESDLPTVDADPTRITQVFQNLLSNAIKYMDKPQGNISVGCTEEGDFWRFRVSDNGPGVAQKDFERIFKLFQTLTRRDDSESTGVGLTITKKIVELYGGKIWVESEVGRGSTFLFTFPKRSATVPTEALQTCAVGS
jgi:two-component system sensor kinase FixL